MFQSLLWFLFCFWICFDSVWSFCLVFGIASLWFLFCLWLRFLFCFWLYLLWFLFIFYFALILVLFLALLCFNSCGFSVPPVYCLCRKHFWQLWRYSLVKSKNVFGSDRKKKAFLWYSLNFVITKEHK